MGARAESKVQYPHPIRHQSIPPGFTFPLPSQSVLNFISVYITHYYSLLYSLPPSAPPIRQYRTALSSCTVPVSVSSLSPSATALPPPCVTMSPSACQKFLHRASEHGQVSLHHRLFPHPYIHIPRNASALPHFDSFIRMPPAPIHR